MPDQTDVICNSHEIALPKLHSVRGRQNWREAQVSQAPESELLITVLEAT